MVCRQELVPAGTQAEVAWRCLRVAGAMPFTLVGVLASLTRAVAAAGVGVGVGVFVVSTFDAAGSLTPGQRDFRLRCCRTKSRLLR